MHSVKMTLSGPHYHCDLLVQPIGIVVKSLPLYQARCPRLLVDALAVSEVEYDLRAPCKIVLSEVSASGLPLEFKPDLGVDDLAFSALCCSSCM